MFDILIVTTATVLLFGIFFGFIAFMRWMRYKETVALAERGLLRKPPQAGDTPNRQTRYGVIFTAIGAALTCGLATIGLDPFTPILGPWLLGGMLPLAVGLSLLYLGRTGQHSNQQMQSGDMDINDVIPEHKRN